MAYGLFVSHFLLEFVLYLEKAFEFFEFRESDFKRITFFELGADLPEQQDNYHQEVKYHS